MRHAYMLKYSMIDKLSPTMRRCVLKYAAKENVTFDVALEIILFKGLQAIEKDAPHTVIKSVDNP